MEQIRTKVRRWGNSFGILLPKAVVHKEHLEVGSELTVTLHKKGTMTVGDLMTLGRKLKLNKRLKRSTDEVLRELDKELWGTER